MGKLAPFVGAGASIPSGFPSASELMAELRSDLGHLAQDAEPTLRSVSWIYEPRYCVSVPQQAPEGHIL
jgi:hypothetical protein